MSSSITAQLNINTQTQSRTVLRAQSDSKECGLPQLHLLVFFEVSERPRGKECEREPERGRERQKMVSA